MIFAGESIRNDNMAPVSAPALRSKMAQGPFFFISGHKQRGRMTKENDTTTELCSGFQGIGGGAYQQAFRKI